ncbi:MAG: hypothetical protein LBF64_02830 [Oscillospiraceae bacterium]|jgi:hypothetical protein|nr:hypothetical protein [Oscillospiraceae bacterium]
MKRWILTWLIILLVVAIVNIGAKTTHTDVTKDIPDDFSMVADYNLYNALYAVSLSDAELFLQSYDDMPVVVKATATGRMWQHYNVTLMECTVQDVYKGDASLVGKTVRYIFISYFDAEVKALSFGTVNFMQQGDDYLVFMQEWERPVGWKEDGNLYYYIDPTYGAAYRIPYFNFADVENVIPNSNEYDSILGPTYGQMMENEVFVRDKQSLEMFLALKKRVFEVYVAAQ